MRICRHCDTAKPLSEFGVNNARKDKTNIYCRKCVSAKMEGQRRAISEMRAANKAARFTAKIQEQQEKNAPEQRVLFALQRGARTQKEIRRRAKLRDEQLGLALVNLILVEKKVVSRVNSNEQREYFISEAA